MDAWPFMVEVMDVPPRLSTFVLMIGAPALATPLTVVVIVLVVDASLMEFTMGTVEPVTPFTVVLSALTLDVLLTPDTALEVAATPLTVDVRVLPDRPSALVVPVVTDVGLTQLALPLASLCII